MNSLLPVLIICSLKINLISAIPIEYNGVDGIFLTNEESKKLLTQVEVEIPLLKDEIKLLKKQIEVEERIRKDITDAVKVEEKISLAWKKNYETSLKEIEMLKRKDRTRLYVYTGLFIGGTLLGAGVMYISSMLIKNIK